MFGKPEVWNLWAQNTQKGRENWRGKGERETKIDE